MTNEETELLRRIYSLLLKLDADVERLRSIVQNSGGGSDG